MKQLLCAYQTRLIKCALQSQKPPAGGQAAFPEGQDAWAGGGSGH